LSGDRFAVIRQCATVQVKKMFFSAEHWIRVYNALKRGENKKFYIIVYQRFTNLLYESVRYLSEEDSRPTVQLV